MKGIGIVIIMVVIAAIIGGYFLFSSMNQSTIRTGNVINNPSTDTLVTNLPTSNPPAETPKTYNVEIENYAFSSSEIRIKKGDTVIWTNMDSVSHTVTSDSGSELDSDYFSKGNIYSHTFNTAGTYNYYCKPHPSMKAKIIVE